MHLCGPQPRQVAQHAAIAAEPLLCSRLARAHLSPHRTTRRDYLPQPHLDHYDAADLDEETPEENAEDGYAARAAAEEEMDRRDRGQNLRSRVPDFMQDDGACVRATRCACGVQGIGEGVTAACMRAEGGRREVGAGGPPGLFCKGEVRHSSGGTPHASMHAVQCLCSRPAWQQQHHSLMIAQRLGRRHGLPPRAVIASLPHSRYNPTIPQTTTRSVTRSTGAAAAAAPSSWAPRLKRRCAGQRVAWLRAPGHGHATVPH